MKEHVRAQAPAKDQLLQRRWLRPLAHRLGEAGLWHMRAEAVARGAAIGLFWAFAVPFAQVLFAAAHCVWWRANIPVAAALTFITNPFTIGGWLWLAYQVGSRFVGPAGAVPPAGDWLSKMQALGWPTAVGMALFAVVGSLLGYVSVRLGARMWFHWRVWQRRRRQAASPASSQGRR
ncbi:MAG: DUF2062 domain-containing protein [Burkholderiaceae bacterium]